MPAMSPAGLAVIGAADPLAFLVGPVKVALRLQPRRDEGRRSAAFHRRRTPGRHEQHRGDSVRLRPRPLRDRRPVRSGIMWLFEEGGLDRAQCGGDQLDQRLRVRARCLTGWRPAHKMPASVWCKSAPALGRRSGSNARRPSPAMTANRRFTASKSSARAACPGRSTRLECRFHPQPVAQTSNLA